MGSSSKARKHYKKDSPFVTDLYTFTYDDSDLDDDKEPVKEQPKSDGTIASLQKSDETKEAEREDLVARFDRVVRGDPDETLQV